MNKVGIVASLLILLSAAVHGQEQQPQLLIHAVRCLAIKHQLPPTKKMEKLSFGYLVDDKSYPGEHVLYVVNFAGPTRSNGLAFTIFLEQQDHRQVFNIQNNASFVFGDTTGEISFVNPPLGGTWTHEHLASAIKQIEKEPRYTVSVKEIPTEDHSISCVSYTDSQK
jgi:hypothetical protein